MKNEFQNASWNIFSPTYLYSTNWVTSGINCKNWQGHNEHICIHAHTHAYAHMHVCTQVHLAWKGLQAYASSPQKPIFFVNQSRHYISLLECLWSKPETYTIYNTNFIKYTHLNFSMPTIQSRRVRSSFLFRIWFKLSHMQKLLYL